VLEVALGLFRKRGFDKTTMREIAAESGMSLGAAYYYFPSKEAIVLEYYEQRRSEQEVLARKAYAETTDLRSRLGAAFHATLDVLRADRRLMGALFRSVGDPSDPVSVLGKGTKNLRTRSIDVLGEALDGQGLPDDVRALAAPALWALQMGMLLYVLYDRSAGQTRTRTLVDRSLDLVVPLLQLAATPMAQPLRRQLMDVLSELGLPTARAVS
jgi:AcrR family transcriptional regulator